ncbi:PACE efflux transporter [Alcaligenes sp. WGS1538]|uniref:PACE efflux transporter n=1 Tax=Alcaligenes sp. WGS1538 TaxID=3366811 RepID=UPI00372D2C66
MTLQGWKRRVLYVGLFEFFAIIFSSFLLAYFVGGTTSDSVPIAIAISAIAIAWNYVFNTVFEYWESRQAVKGRSVLRRSVHAIGFEAGLILFIVPMYMWWYQVGLLEALQMEVAILVFFLVYSFSFSWSFDRVFGLPSSAA